MVIVKNQVSLSVLMCVMMSLTHPAWSMNDDMNEDGKKNHNQLKHYLATMSPEERKAAMILMADAGDKKSQWKLAKEEKQKIVNVENKSEWKQTLPWLMLAAKQGHPKAQRTLGEYYEEAAKSLGEAMKYYHLAAATYEKGHEWNKATYLHMKAADQNHAPSQFFLALACIEGLMNEAGLPEFERSIPLLQSAADQGCPKASFRLGWNYESGQGVPRNMRRAIKYYTIAAKQGDQDASWLLGRAYKDGFGHPHNEPEWKKAMIWFGKAAEKGHREAQADLAYAYSRGFGNKEGKPELNKAITLYALSAQQGYDRSLCILGVYYQKGNSALPQDFAKASQMYTSAIKAGLAQAQNCLASIPKKLSN